MITRSQILYIIIRAYVFDCYHIKPAKSLLSLSSFWYLHIYRQTYKHACKQEMKTKLVYDRLLPTLALSSEYMYMCVHMYVYVQLYNITALNVHLRCDYDVQRNIMYGRGS